jgi:hypothetical protein
MAVKAFLLGLFIAVVGSCYAQMPPVDATRIAVTSLTGVWVTGDSSDFIEFKKMNGMLEIYPVVHANPYMFTIDIANTVSPVGVAPNWPPYDCKLALIDSVSLAITYYSVFDSGNTVNYRKSLSR